MAGNPCEELSPTGGKHKIKYRTRSYCTVLRQWIKSSQLINHKCSSKPGDLPRTQ